MSKELESVRLLAGTFLVQIEEDSERTSESGLVLSSKRSQKTGKIVKASGYELGPNMKRVTVDCYGEGDTILIDTNRFDDSKYVALDGEKYYVCTREDIKLILDRE